MIKSRFGSLVQVFIIYSMNINIAILQDLKRAIVPTTDWGY